MINKSELLERFEKLLWVDDETLVNAENLNRLEDFMDLLDQRTRSQVGDVIESSVYSDMQQVIDRYGGEYWILLGRPDVELGRTFYTWLRSDVDPSTTELKSYSGMAIITSAGAFESEASVKEKYGGSTWLLVNKGDKNNPLEHGYYDVWLRNDVYEKPEKKIPAFEGMIVFSTRDLSDIYEGEWKKVEGFEMKYNDIAIHEYICTECQASVLTGLGSCVGMLSLSSNLTKEDRVKEVYDATSLAKTIWSGYTSYALKQWIRNA